MRFVDEHSDRFAVALLLRVLQIGESTYYAWKKQAEQPCDRDLVDRGLLANIYEPGETSGRTYGADRVHRQLRRDDLRVGRKCVERLMKQQGGKGAFLRRGWRGGSSTRQDPRRTPAPDLVNRDFTAACPNRLWVADATGIPCGECSGWPPSENAIFEYIDGWYSNRRIQRELGYLSPDGSVALANRKIKARLSSEEDSAVSSLDASTIGVRRLPVPGRRDHGRGPLVSALRTLLPRRRRTPR
jgi:hypothetical protein